MTTHATGTFDVTLTPQGPPEQSEGIAVGRMTVDKQFHGDLEGTSKVQMLTAAADSTGAGAYVAIERVTGTLHGRRGSFVLMHSGTRTPDGQHLTVTVAPGLGTGQLAGLAGTMTISVVDKQHRYALDYTLPPAR
ncbi:MAG TPA: DUF3224 domain-containing protein [Gemmatimonadales bacterium]|nr:DUF3224 domain-containing protein [Gemmatimonadales bacterium]